ncbi:hypothetical protein DBR40_01005 [Pedobacter sp. KBW01]|uniref:hypothetical protein n=1 Tax=Pedobacter sp. KBW01 TaxID=2153364 RepID=UPI000F59ABD5|nr:hypothetical protein [Pedobacter sp. KBW01]RQO80227.1 hypothetical protein DBR40_01005 [Pedobacter sp. KBW01]
MKKIKFSLFLLLCSVTVFAQVYTDPNSGYVGVATTSPLAPFHVSGGTAMTHGWRRTSLLQATYPAQVFNSANNKYGAVGYDYSNGLFFWVNASSEDVSAVSPAVGILNDGNVVIGSGGITNPQGWNKVLQVNGNQHAKLLVTESNGVKLGMYAHVGYNAKIGTESDHNLTFTAGYWNDVMTLTTGGSVGIGTLTPNEKLAVNGKIRAREIKVEAANWPDYVFEAGYDVGTLEKLESYIKANKHLPEMPSAKEVEANGVELGEMNKLLLKKQEELTLLLIDQHKQLQKLAQKVAVQEQELKKLKLAKKK